MGRSLQHFARTSIIFLGGIGALVPVAATAELSGTLALSSDYVFRGVSQTTGKPALQAGIDVALPADVTVFGWASNVDFTTDGAPDDGADLELDLGIAISRNLGAVGVVEAGLTRYLYPDLVAGLDYDYDEALLAWTIRDRIRAEVAYSADVFASGEPAFAWQLAVSQPLPLAISLSLAYGRYELDDALGTDYAFGSVAVSRTFGPLTVALAYHDTSSAATQLFPAAAVGDRVVGSLELVCF